MECRILVRKTLPWHKIRDMDHFKSMCSFPQILPFVEEWNKVLNMPYWVFRSKVKEIANKSLRRTGIPVMTNLRRVGRKFNRIVIPIDDDDWLAPNIKDVLPNLFSDPKVRGVCWDNAVFRIIYKGVELGYYPVQSCTMSCCYAVRTSLPKRRWVRDMQFISYKKSHPKSVLNYNEKFLSMYLRHIGAVGGLKEFGRMKFPVKYKMPDVFDRRYAWSEPYVSEFVNLMNSLNLKWNIKLQ